MHPALLLLLLLRAGAPFLPYLITDEVVASQLHFAFPLLMHPALLLLLLLCILLHDIYNLVSCNPLFCRRAVPAVPDHRQGGGAPPAAPLLQREAGAHAQLLLRQRLQALPQVRNAL
jgi:hypothetical protein